MVLYRLQGTVFFEKYLVVVFSNETKSKVHVQRGEHSERKLQNYKGRT